MAGYNSNSVIPLINGAQHSWASIKCRIGILTIVGITEINYKTEQEISDNYGIGVDPIGRGFGRRTYSADITLYREEVEALRAASMTGRLQDLGFFDIVVSFLPFQGQKPITHIIKNCSIKNDDVSASEGQTSNSVALALQPSHIVYDTLRGPLLANIY